MIHNYRPDMKNLIRKLFFFRFGRRHQRDPLLCNYMMIFNTQPRARRFE